jgi:hypothetical protein
MPKKKKKRIEVHWYRRAIGKHQLAAVFEIEDDKVIKTEWEIQLFREMMEGHGVVVGDKILGPKDGVAFVEALEAAFSNSTSFLVVVK